MSGTTVEAVPAVPATLLTPDPAATAAAVPDPAKPAVPAEAKAVEAAKAPETYDFKQHFPEGTTVNQPLIDGFTELAKASNLTQEQADKYVALYTKHQAEEKAALDLAVKQQRTDWIKEAQADPTLGGAKYDESIVEGRKGIKWGNDPALESLLLDSGFDAHPAVLRFMVKVAKAIGEDHAGGTSAGSGEKTPKEIADGMYPSMAAKE